MAAKKTTKKKARAKSKVTKKAAAGNPKMDWLVGFMKKKPTAVYADAAAAANKARIDIYPIMWGRAQVMLGRVKQKPRGQGKAAVAKRPTSKNATTGKRRGRPPGSKNKPKAPAEAKTVVKRGPGRPQKYPRAGLSIPIADGDLATVKQLVDAVNGGARASLRYDGGSWSLAVG